MSGEQTNANVLVALKRESTPGTAAGATGGTRFRLTDSPGLKLQRGRAQSAEKRSDGNQQLGRLAGKSVAGTLNSEWTVGGHSDILAEAIMRSTWSAAATHTQTELTSLAVASNVITAGGGSFVTQGYRVGQIIRLTGMTQAANNDVNLLVVAVTTSTLTVVGATMTDESADTTFSITRLKNVVNAASPTEYHHSVEQNDTGIDASELFLGCKLVGMAVTIQPNAPVTVAYTFMGLDRTPFTGVSAPYFTTPSLTTGLALVGDDLALYYNGSVVTTFTSLTLDFTINAQGQPVLGSLVSPDIFANDLVVSGQASGTMADFANVTLYDAETEFELGVLLEDPTSTAPFDCAGLFFPVVKIGDRDAPVGGGDGAKIETLDLMFGTKASGVTGHEATIATISSSA